MDSKSISRKGVGVRLPSLAPGTDGTLLLEAAHELGRELVPFLCQRLRRATHVLGRAEQRLVAERELALRDEAEARRQDELAAELARAGYCLGVLGAGARADLLRARREPRGLRWLVAEAAAAHGARLEPGEDALPALPGSGERAWRSALLAGWCAAQAARQARRVTWTRAGDELVFVLARPLASAARQRARALGLAARARSLALTLS